MKVGYELQILLLKNHLGGWSIMHQSFGKIIKLTRIEKNIKQEELCEGICTPSYLSRIENNRVIADKQIYHLLLNRLGVNIENNQINTEEIDSKIEEWYEQLITNKTSTIKIDELRETARTAGEDIYLKFRIVYCRYLLKSNQLEEAKKHIEDLQKTMQITNHRHILLFTNVVIVFYYMNKEYLKAVDYASKLIQFKNFESLANPFEVGIFYYNLALNYKNLYRYEKGIYFAKQALDIFKEWYFLDCAIQCHVLLGICYNNLQNWETAFHSYSVAKKIIPYLPKDDHEHHLSIIENNIGNCYENQGDYKIALQYYLKSYENKKNEGRIINILNILRCYYMLGDFEQSKHWLQLGQDNEQENAPKKYVLQLDIFNILLHSDNDNISINEIISLETECIKFLTSEQIWGLVIYYCKIFAHLYKERNLYKKASEMYELALMINEKIRERGDR